MINAGMKQVPSAKIQMCQTAFAWHAVLCLAGTNMLYSKGKAIKGGPVAVLPPQLLMRSPRQSSLRLAGSVGVWACTQQPKVLDAKQFVKHMRH